MLSRGVYPPASTTVGSSRRCSSSSTATAWCFPAVGRVERGVRQCCSATRPEGRRRPPREACAAPMLARRMPPGAAGVQPSYAYAPIAPGSRESLGEFGHPARGSGREHVGVRADVRPARQRWRDALDTAPPSAAIHPSEAVARPASGRRQSGPEPSPHPPPLPRRPALEFPRPPPNPANSDPRSPIPDYNGTLTVSSFGRIRTVIDAARAADFAVQVVEHIPVGLDSGGFESTGQSPAAALSAVPSARWRPAQRRASGAAILRPPSPPACRRPSARAAPAGSGCRTRGRWRTRSAARW